MTAFRAFARQDTIPTWIFDLISSRVIFRFETSESVLYVFPMLLMKMPKAFHAIFSAIFLVLMPIGIGKSLSVEARQSSSINAATRMLEWNQKYNEAYVQLVEVYNTDSITSLYTVDYNDFDAVKSAYSHYNSQREAILAKASNMFSDLEPPQRWNFQKTLFDKTEKALFQACLKAYEGKDSLQADVREGSDFLPMINALEEGRHEEAVDGFIEKQFAANKALVKAENEQIDSFLLAIPNDHPNQQFQEIIQLGNELSLIELDLATIEMKEGLTNETRSNYAELMSKTIQPIPGLIMEGRINLSTLKDKLNTYLRSLSSDNLDRPFFERAVAAAESFDESFDIEQDIYENFQASVSVLLMDLKESDRTVKADALDLEFFALVDQRIKVSTERLNKMSQ